MSRIVIEEGGFELVSDSGEPIAFVSWDEVDRIEAYNGQLSNDSEVICLDFFHGEGFTSVTEEDRGFEDLAPQLIANLDLENPDWFNVVQRPSTNRVLVFDREAGY